MIPAPIKSWWVAQFRDGDPSLKHFANDPLWAQIIALLIVHTEGALWVLFSLLVVDALIAR